MEHTAHTAQSNAPILNHRALNKDSTGKTEESHLLEQREAQIQLM